LLKNKVSSIELAATPAARPIQLW